MAKNKKLSTFLDFDVNKNSISENIFEKNKETGEYGITSEKVTSISKLAFIVCPLCGNHHKLNKTGGAARKSMKRRTAAERVELKEQIENKLLVRSRAKLYNPAKELKFDRVDLHTEPFISIRQASGRGRGLPEVGIIPFSELDKLDEENKVVMREYVKQIYFKCKEILEEIEKLDL
jgi:hypothetical protein